MKLNLATKITIFRIILIPVMIIVLLFNNNDDSINIFGFKVYVPYLWALLIYVVAALSDALDGYIARSTNTVTNLGKLLDPIADKLLVNCLLLFFLFQNYLDFLSVLIIISRDIIVDALRMVCLENKVVIAASNLGKIKTILHMVTIGLVLFFAYPKEQLPTSINILVYLCVLMSLVSGFDYFKKNYSKINF